MSDVVTIITAAGMAVCAVVGPQLKLDTCEPFQMYYASDAYLWRTGRLEPWDWRGLHGRAMYDYVMHCYVGELSDENPAACDLRDDCDLVIITLWPKHGPGEGDDTYLCRVRRPAS